MWNKMQGQLLVEERLAERDRIMAHGLLVKEALAARKAEAAIRAPQNTPTARVRRSLGALLVGWGERLMGKQRAMRPLQPHKPVAHHTLTALPGMGLVLSPVRGRPAAVVSHRRVRRRL